VPCPVFLWGPPGLLAAGACCWVGWGLRSLNAAFPCRSCLSYFMLTTVLFVPCGGCKKSPRTCNQCCYIFILKGLFGVHCGCPPPCPVFIVQWFIFISTYDNFHTQLFFNLTILQFLCPMWLRYFSLVTFV
jgi:hypothetical protein